MLHVLPDGTRLVIRPIAPADKVALAAALGRLSGESTRRRFLAAKPRLSSAELRYLTEVDGSDHIALVAVLEAEPATIVAVARCVRLEPGGDTAEFAIVVGDPVQGQGLGTVLAGALAARAAAAGVKRFLAIMLPDNGAIERLMEGFSTHRETRAHEGGLREVVAELDAA